MHPLFVPSKLQGLDKAIFEALSLGPRKAVSRAELMKVLEMPSTQQITVARALSKLCGLGIVDKSGTTRGTTYKLSAETVRSCLMGFGRPKMGYDPLRISDYVPDTSNWLPLAAAAEMAQVAQEARSQLETSAYAREIAERLLVEMSWASAALEGNAYSLHETEALVKFGEVAVGRLENEDQMILNHKQAINWIIEDINNVAIAPETVFRLHAMLMRSLSKQSDLGKIRNNKASVSAGAYIPSANYADLSSGLATLCLKASETSNPYEASFMLMAGLAYLRPFVDGNACTGRLLSIIPLLQSGLPPITYVGVNSTEHEIAMTNWLELGDTEALAVVFVDSYTISAPHYLVETVTKRVPRSVELRLRKQLDQAVAEYVAGAVDDHALDANAFAMNWFKGTEDADKQIIVDSFVEIIEGINGYNCLAYGVDPEIAEAFLTSRNGMKMG